MGWKDTPGRPIRFRRTALICCALTALAFGRAHASRPLLVTVDDLPLASGRLHPDPGERARITEELLAALGRHEIPAVGLVTCGNIRGPGDLALLEQWLEAGHELGNHTYHHTDYTRSRIETFLADVESCRERLSSLLQPRGREVRFFRFPMLHEGDTPKKLEMMRGYLERSGQQNLPVTLDNQDWSYEEPWVEARRAGDEQRMHEIGEDYLAALRLSIRHHERTGDRLFGRELPQILLLHANEVGAAHWDRLFDWLKRTGHRFVGVDELLSDPVFEETHAFVGPAGFSLWDRLAAERWEVEARQQAGAHLDRQIAAWNRGDLEAFCAGYDVDAVFITPSGITHGRGEILSRYRRRYTDRAAMGTLKFEVIDLRPVRGVEISMLGDSRPGRVHAVSVVARWTLAYPDRDGGAGLTQLLLHRRGEGWSIAHDASM